MASKGRFWAGVCLALWLSACGGGGGGSASSTGGTPSATVARQQVTVAASASSATTPSATVDISVANMPQDGLYVGGDFTENGLVNMNVVGQSDTSGQLVLTFKPPWSLPDGVYTDQVTLNLCLDQACTRQVAGSPFNLTVSYTVSGSTVVSADKTSLVVSTGTAQTVAAAPETVRLTLQGPTPATSVYVMPSVDTSSGRVSTLATSVVSSSQVDVQVGFYAGAGAVPGTYTDTVRIKLCYDIICTRELAGSPVLVNTSVTVTPGVAVDSSLPALPYTSRNALSHDVVDTEYSRSLDALVMVSASPSNALFVHDPRTGTERRLALNARPVAVSVSPDGNFAAVAHDARITYVDLREVGLNTAYTPTILNVSSDAFDVVLDGRGYAHVMPLTDQWVSVHSVKTASNTETLGIQFLRAGSHARLHPGGTAFYVANNGLSPDDIERYNLDGDGVTRVADSPYHGDYPMCGDLWFSEDGGTIYTACGRTFRSSSDPTQDMRYSGTMGLSSALYGYRIRSLSHRGANKQIALIEEDANQCNPFMSVVTNCPSHVAFYESDFLNRTALYALAPIEVNLVMYSQQGLFISHLADGSKALVSRLVNLSNPGNGYYVTWAPAEGPSAQPASVRKSPNKAFGRWH